MAKIKEIRLSGTTTTAGAVTVNATKAVAGKLFAVAFDKGTLADATNFVVSAQVYDVVKTLLTVTSAGAADAFYYPRDLVHDASAAALVGTAGGDRTMPLIVGIPRLAIASGGSEKTGGVIIFYEED